MFDPESYFKMTFSSEWINNVQEEVKLLLDNYIRVLVYYGDQDFICNWKGGLEWVDNLEWK